ncbi:integral membrane sensor signal transduction histidine kinase [Methanoregula boonei 6A8]|uniref:histidine kinase n=1 Tax=Methanoregula boonei (strain DSM 21154 / JCM 14090 / 6A8) TaxID=456442 RepID=A7IB12_METB6|nr:CHASE4 domain-containing protein [Methanoregula boonei]ABS56923.1 integral membrane sensor signal transduction histidine kinase [Methanoregula boonei 6A8]
MKVRTRSRLILAAMAFIFLIGLSFITQFVILDSFRSIEKQQMSANVERVIANLNDQEKIVSANCRDWAGRDDTYAFAGAAGSSGNSSAFNQPLLLGTLDVDYLLIYNTSGDLVFSEGALNPDGTEEVVPQQLDGIIKDSIIPAGVPGGVSGRHGASFLNGAPVILAGYSIKGSNQSAPSRGTLVMVRVLNSKRIGDMESVLQIPAFTLAPASSGVSFGTFSDTDLQKMKKGGIVSQPVNNSLMGGTAMISGIEDRPTFLVVQVFTDRMVYSDVQTSILIIAASIVALSAIFIIAVQFLLQRFVLGPLSALDNDMQIIGRSGDLSRRIPEKGDEEIVSVTRAFNQMLADLEENQEELSVAQDELAQHNRKLEELNRKANLYLDIYLDVITYEILNSIMGLRGYAEYLTETAGEKEKRFLKKIVELAQKSSNVIRNIETISRIYKMQPGVVAVNLEEIIRKEAATRPDIQISVTNCNRRVLANDMLGVVFDNLFSNSLKFGGAGVAIEISATDNEQGVLEISVADNGPGIPDEMKPGIFDRFAKDSKTRSSYGLGLHIVKMLMDGYGGRIWADDRIHGDPSSGVAIRFTLNLAE